MDPRLLEDIHRLSTSDVVLCYTILCGMRTEATLAGDRRMAGEFSARLRACELELTRRQGQLFDSSEGD